MNDKHTYSYIRECFNYDDETGVLSWRERPKSHFKNEGAWKTWNSRFSGESCSTIHSMFGIDYFAIKLDYKRYLVHRIIWLYVYGEWPEQIDHIDGVGVNNKLENLRNVNASGNSKNKKIDKRNKTGVLGVSLNKLNGKWQAKIVNDRKNIYLGCFEDFNDAVIARKVAEYEYGFHINHGRKKK